MKGVQIVEPNKLQIVDLEKPQIDKENNVLVRMVAAGICGSDVASTMAPMPLPLIPASSATRTWASLRRSARV